MPLTNTVQIVKTSIHRQLNAACTLGLFVALVLLSALRLHAQANANPPGLMTYQGFLVDADGMPLGTNAPKNYDVIFRIFDASSSGMTLWAEQQTVTVDKGYFSVLLGEGSNIGEPRPALSTLFANNTASERWVGVTVKGIGASGSDANILPRLRLLTTPYSYLAQKAATVDGAALTSGTVPDVRLSANVALRSGGNTFSDNQIFNNNLGIGTTSPGFPLSFGTSAGDRISLSGNSGNHFGFGIQSGLLQIHTDTTSSDIALGYGASGSMTETMRVKGNGKVGIGTATPSSSLEVTGGIRARGGAPGSGGANNNGYAFSGNSGDNDSGLFSSADGVLQFYANSVEMARINSTGLGIGTNSPQAKLHVAGAGNFLGSTPYIKFSDEKNKGTPGGTANAGVNFRAFTAKSANWGSIGLFGAGLVLPAGTYQCRISTPAYRVHEHQARLRIFTGSILLFGTSEMAGTDAVVTTRSLIEGQFTLSADSTLLVEHWVKAGNADNGLGVNTSASWTDGDPKEVYTVAEFWRLQ